MDYFFADPDDADRAALGGRPRGRNTILPRSATRQKHLPPTRIGYTPLDIAAPMKLLLLRAPKISAACCVVT
ncbi:MAG: hypothetical protein C0511_19310 [Hyphomicrobium sp.]|nr:hypothetical protein [Hyphomicrobium sp.]